MKEITYEQNIEIIKRETSLEELRFNMRKQLIELESKMNLERHQMEMEKNRVFFAETRKMQMRKHEYMMEETEAKKGAGGER